MSSLFFDPSCPSGGSWYVCNTPGLTRFVGCCKNDPCQSINGCSIGNLRPASFDAAQYGKFPDQGCDEGLPYSCAYTSPPFLGCCKSNTGLSKNGTGISRNSTELSRNSTGLSPCAHGSCPTENLVGMKLSGDPLKAAVFLGTTVSSSTSLSSSATSSSSSTSASTSLVLLVDAPHQTGAPTAAIAGIAVGCTSFIALAIAIFFLMRTKIRRLHKRMASSQGAEHAESIGNLGDTTYPAITVSNDGMYLNSIFQHYC